MVSPPTVERVSRPVPQWTGASEKRAWRPALHRERRLSHKTTTSDTLFVLPPPESKSRRDLRPLWRDLILKIWGEDPMICPCCKGTVKTAGTMIRRDEVQFFLQLHGLWEGILALPPPPRPPYDIETMEPLNVPPQWGWTDEIESQPEQWWRFDHLLKKMRNKCPNNGSTALYKKPIF